MSAATAGTRRPQGLPADAAVIDCDVHIAPAAPEVLFPYLPAYWQGGAVDHAVPRPHRHRLSAGRGHVASA